MFRRGSVRDTPDKLESLMATERADAPYRARCRRWCAGYSGRTRGSEPDVYLIVEVLTIAIAVNGIFDGVRAARAAPSALTTKRQEFFGSQEKKISPAYPTFLGG